MRIIVDKVALGQVFLQVSCYPLLVIIPALHHTHQSPPPEVSDQAVHYRILGVQTWDFMSNPVSGWLLPGRRRTKQTSYLTLLHF
jgi:hypothetical protein